MGSSALANFSRVFYFDGKMSKHTEFYERLGVTPTASQADM
jgi:hypothetical protein